MVGFFLISKPKFQRMKNLSFSQIIFNLSTIFLVGSASLSQLNAQCIAQEVIVTGTNCNNNGTPNNPNDDTFTANVYIDHQTIPTGSWTSNSTPSSGGYGGVVTFVQFPISAGNVALTITNAATPSCFDNVTLIAPPSCNITCPNFGVCLSLYYTYGCCATYEATFAGLGSVT